MCVVCRARAALKIINDNPITSDSDGFINLPKMREQMAIVMAVVEEVAAMQPAGESALPQVVITSLSELMRAISGEMEKRIPEEIPAKDKLN